MAAARYSQDVLEEFFGEIPRRESERRGEPSQKCHGKRERFDFVQMAIKNLPPEIREIIYKELIAIKEMVWSEVHDHIKNAPFCEKLQRITKVCYCRNCASCRINGRCYERMKKGENHYLDFPYPTLESYNENFQKFY